MAKSPLERARPIANQGHVISADRARRLAEVFSALADPQRITIVNLLLIEGYVRAGGLAEDMGLSQSRVSYHLKQLLDAGIIESGREGNFIYYNLVEGVFARIAALLG